MAVYVYDACRALMDKSSGGSEDCAGVYNCCNVGSLICTN